METLGHNSFWSFDSVLRTVQRSSNDAVRRDSGHTIRSYIELSKKVAELQFRNRDYVLLFRGQGKDYRNKKDKTTLRPSIFRVPPSKKILTSQDLELRYEHLTRAEGLLVRAYGKRLGWERLRRQRVLRWSILQHYEVCATPVLDVTQSLRIAVSFAHHDAVDAECYLFVLAVPNISGAITASAEAGMQIMRLSSVCPPEAVRPHIQEGYLIGEYPDLGDIKQKGLYSTFEIDCSQRMLCKFKLDTNTLVSSPHFPIVNRVALYPDSDDPIYKMMQLIKTELGPDPTIKLKPIS